MSFVIPACSRTFVLFFSVFIFAAFGEPTQQSADNPVASISGTVLDAQGKAVAAAHATLTRPRSSDSFSTQSDSGGHFTFRAIEGGEYQLTISANGFQSQAQAIDTESRVNFDLTLTLQVAASQTTVNVQGRQNEITESSAQSGSLSPVRLLDLPQSVQVVNRTLLDEQKTFDFADSLTYLAGVQRAYTSIAGGLGNEVAMRGFNLDFSNNYLRDGFKFYGLTLSDTADIERIEVLKGPASALYGTAEAGGIVNLITKKPTETPFVALSMTSGNFNFVRPEFDIPVRSTGTKHSSID